MTEGTKSGPRVSILLPVFDAAATLDLCLRSLDRQSETRWQCITVDDGSTDGSGALLEAAARRDPRIRVIRTAHAGIVSALETGLAACAAPFVARMDADDWMHRERLRAQLSLFERHPELTAVGSRVRMFPRSTLSAGRRRYEAWLNGIDDPESVRRDAYVECPVAHPTLMIRTEALRRIGYQDRGWPEDYDLVLRLLQEGARIAVHPARLLGWRDSPDRLSRRSPDYALDRFTACKAAHLAEGFLRSTNGYMLWGHGPTGRALKRALAALGHTPRYIVEMHPRRIGQRIDGVPVIAPEQIGDVGRWPLVASVAGPIPRGEIRAALEGMGWREGLDFVCAA